MLTRQGLKRDNDDNNNIDDDEILLLLGAAGVDILNLLTIPLNEVISGLL